VKNLIELLKDAREFTQENVRSHPNGRMALVILEQ